jgi:hypothetical protein
VQYEVEDGLDWMADYQDCPVDLHLSVSFFLVTCSVLLPPRPTTQLPQAAGLLVLFACFALSVHALSEAKQCGECRRMATRFKEVSHCFAWSVFVSQKQGLSNTAKSGFGGGNTAWEERNLGTFATR